MSKIEGKRGLARTQHTSAIISPEFDAASQKVRGELVAFEAHCDEVFARGENTARDARDAFDASVDALFGIPSPSGAGLARKIELFAYPHHIDAFLSDPAARAKIAAEGDDDEKKLLILYLDAMALSGVTASVPVEAVTLDGKADDGLLDWAGIVRQAREVADNFGGMRAGPKGSPAWEETLAQLIEQAAALAALPAEGRTAERVLEAATAAERLGRVLCEDDGGYRNWAINPQGLCELVEMVTRLQTSARELARETHPGVAGLALERAFYSHKAPPPQPPRGPGGGARAPQPANDPAGAEYVAARRAASEAGHYGGNEDKAQERFTAAGDAILRTPPVDMEGVAVRLGYILSNAFLYRAGEWDCPLCIDKRKPVEPPTDAELCASAEGDNGGLDALFGALAVLHLNVEKAAAYDPEARRIAYEWNAAREATHAAWAAHDISDSDEDLERLCDAQERWEALTPPSLEALAEVVGYSLSHGGPLSMVYQSADDPRAIRDLLDSGDAEDVIAARAYLHMLRMTGSVSPAVLTPPIAGLFPGFDPSKVEDGKAGDMQAGWVMHHRLAEPHEDRVAEFASWLMPERPEGGGGDEIEAVCKYSTALHAAGQALIAEYESLGGRFNLVRSPDGQEMFGTVYARDGSPRSGEIEYLVANRQPLRRAIACIIRKRDGVHGAASNDQRDA